MSLNHVPSNGSNKMDSKDDKPPFDTSSPRPSINESADQLLTNMGYKPELSRNRSTFQVAFMSFVLASIPYGLATTLYYPLVGGGPVNIIWGWVLVSCIIVCVAASLGEITSVYPTAGGNLEHIFFTLSPSPPHPSRDLSDPSPKKRSRPEVREIDLCF